MSADGTASGPSKFFAELKRRNVVRVALVYLGTAWLIVHVGTVLGETFETPHWVMRTVVLLLAIGFPVALGFAWMFELTPEGLKPTADVDPQHSVTHHTGRKLDRLIMIVLALVVVGLIIERVVRAPGHQPAEKTATASAVQASVAVLPFVNMSSEVTNEPFADGLSEEVLNVLAGIQGLKVAGRTSSFYFKGKNEKPDVIASTLGVNHLLEGSVRWAGPKVRITAQLIDATTGFHLWSQTFDRELNDVFAVQEEIARQVAGALQVTLLAADEARLAKHGTNDAEAHQLYLVARGRFRERDLASLRAAKTLLEDAIKRDPSYAQAYAGLADTYYLLVANHGEEREHGLELGEKAANRALELDPHSSEAYTSRANFAAYRFQIHSETQDYQRAVADYQRAIELDPTNAQAYHWYGSTVLEIDQERGLELLNRAVALDPLIPQAQVAVATVYLYRWETDKVRQHLNQVIERHPDFANTYLVLGDLQLYSGRLTEARTWYRKAYELSGDPTAATWVSVSSSELGDLATAREWAPRAGGTAYVDALFSAAWLARDRRYQQAFEAFSPLADQVPDNDWAVHSAAHMALIVGKPARAVELMTRMTPSLLSSESEIRYLNSESAVVLAAAWQRMNREADAARLLNRVAKWLDGPDAPRWPQWKIARAEVHALLGEREAALESLDQAFAAGYRGVTAPLLTYKMPYRGEDNVLLENIRSDPRFAAWYTRMHDDVARQLAQARQQEAAGKDAPTTASQSSM